MKKLSLFLENGKNEIYLDRFVRTKVNSKMKIKNATVYRNFKNIIEGKYNNNVITAVPNRIVFEQGYWDFRRGGWTATRKASWVTSVQLHVRSH